MMSKGNSQLIYLLFLLFHCITYLINILKLIQYPPVNSLELSYKRVDYYLNNTIKNVIIDKSFIGDRKQNWLVQEHLYEDPLACLAIKFKQLQNNRIHHYQ